MISVAESALVVLIPEAEAIVERYRMRHDPAAARGVPAHVTVLYPFVAPAALTPAITSTLAEAFGALSAFDAVFGDLGRFPDTLYLAPEPAGYFARLTESVVQRFPAILPYGGRFATIVPHLTIAQDSDDARLHAIAAEFGASARMRLPIRARIRAVALIVSDGENWHTHAEFNLSALGSRGSLPG